MKSNNFKLLIGGLVLTLLAAFIFVWSGVYNIAANEKHWNITSLLLKIVRERSIEARIDDIIVPPLVAQKLIAGGAINYAEMCAQCHLAPGLESSELYEGLYPQPPIFYKRDNSVHEPEEMFWVIKNGIKLTAMPAWEKSHSDEQIWELVAFILAIEKMSPEDYKNISKANGQLHGRDN